MKQRQSGFTLVELLIVLLIIGVLIGITLLAPRQGGFNKTINEQAVKLKLLFEHAKDKALLDSVELGFSIDGEGRYQWWVLPFGEKKWARLEDKPFQPCCLPKECDVTLETDSLCGRLIDLNEHLKTPIIFIDIDRSSTPFNLSFFSKNNKKRIVSLHTDGFSNVEIFRE